MDHKATTDYLIAGVGMPMGALLPDLTQVNTALGTVVAFLSILLLILRIVKTYKE